MAMQNPHPLPYQQQFEPLQQPVQVFQQPQQPVMFYQPNINDGGRIEGFRHKPSRVIGKLQIALGIICIILQSISVGLIHTFSYIIIGYGICSGILFISSGAICLVASNKKSKCSIIACMVLSIISAASCGVLFSFGIIGAYATNRLYYYAKSKEKCEKEGWYYTTTTSYNIDTPACPTMQAVVALQSLVVILAVIEAVVSIWESAICCKAVGCCATSQNTNGILLIPQYTCSSQQISYANPGTFQQVPYYGYPNPATYNQDPQSMPNGQPTLVTYYSDVQMSCNPPPYEQHIQMQAPPPQVQSPPPRMQAPLMQARLPRVQDPPSLVLAPPGLQAPPPPQQLLEAPGKHDDAIC